jgi:hypothetical protein
MHSNRTHDLASARTRATLIAAVCLLSAALAACCSSRKWSDGYDIRTTSDGVTYAIFPPMQGPDRVIIDLPRVPLATSTHTWHVERLDRHDSVTVSVIFYRDGKRVATIDNYDSPAIIPPSSIQVRMTATDDETGETIVSTSFDPPQCWSIDPIRPTDGSYVGDIAFLPHTFGRLDEPWNRGPTTWEFSVRVDNEAEAASFADEIQFVIRANRRFSRWQF